MTCRSICKVREHWAAQLCFLLLHHHALYQFLSPPNSLGSMSMCPKVKEDTSGRTDEKKDPTCQDDKKIYSTGPRFALLITSAYAAMFLVSLVSNMAVQSSAFFIHFYTTNK